MMHPYAYIAFLSLCIFVVVDVFYLAIFIRKQKGVYGNSLPDDAILYIADSPLQGFTSTLNCILLALELADEPSLKRTVYLDTSKWPYGKWSTYFSYSNITLSNRLRLVILPPSFTLHTLKLDRQTLRIINGSILYHPQRILTLQNPFPNFFTLWKSYPSYSNHTHSLHSRRIIASFLFSLHPHLLTTSFYHEIGQNGYVSVHIRRGDKLGSEMSVIDDETYVTASISLSRRMNVSNVIVVSDDYNVCQNVALSIRERGKMKKSVCWDDLEKEVDKKEESVGYQQNIMNGLTQEEREIRTKRFVKVLQVMKDATGVVCTFSSNVCRFVQAIREQAPESVVSLDQPWFRA